MIADSAGIEQSILGACLVQPDRLPEVLSKVAVDDLQEPVHQRALQTLADLHAAGRTPSLESLVAYIGNDEILPNLTVRAYFQRMAREAVVGSFLPLQDAIDAFRDQTRQRRLQDIGNRLANCSISSGEGLAAIADQAVSALDDVIVDLREAKRSNYSLSAAAAAAMAHLDSQAAQYATTGLLDLDNVLGGWPRGQLTVLAGRPGMGKSAAFTSAMLQAARIGEGLSPLEYLLAVMRDESKDEATRLDAAKAAAPYVHPRLAAIEHSGSVGMCWEDALAELGFDETESTEREARSEH